MRAMSRGVFALTLTGGLLAGASGALAMPESCEKDFAPMMQKRQAFIEQINGFKKRKPTAAQACNVFKGLSTENEKIGTWMTSQKDWCQIPDDMLKGVTDAQVQINQTRANVCGAAAKQAAQIKQMQNRARQQQAQPGVGSGVRLPQGAL